MENYDSIRSAAQFEIEKTYCESNYYLYRCKAKGIIFTDDFGTSYQEIFFEVTTKTGRKIGMESKKHAA